MKKTVVRVVCAIGQAGQLGLKGGLPWEGNRSPEFVADVARFFDLTRGHVLLAGPKTIASVPDFAHADRDLVVVRSSMDPEDTLQRFVGRVVFIGGGPPVWDAYARFVSHW
ncbi:MAG: diacylglycerol kinase, partial [Mesorhizobium sp.]